MTDIAQTIPTAAGVGIHTSAEANARLRGRYQAEARFKLYGIIALAVAIFGLVSLLGTIIYRGYSGFQQTYIVADVFIDPALVQKDNLIASDWRGITRAALAKAAGDPQDREERRALLSLISIAADDAVRDAVRSDINVVGQTLRLRLLAHSDVDQLRKGRLERQPRTGVAKMDEIQLKFYDQLMRQGAIERSFNLGFLTGRDSANPEQVGMGGAIVGSAMTLLICLALAFPLGVMTAIYLEEFAPKNRVTDLIEVNINNLAAVPSIVFGLLGLAVFVQFLGLPRSAPIVGGIVIALMSLPVVIIAARAALRAVPPSIRQAAIGLGASKVQVVLHHVLPLAMPGILTGVILAMAHAMGETAPLLMIGMKAFVVDVPGDPLDAATVIPVQIYRWFSQAEPGFYEKTYAGIIVLLVFLLVMNATAVLLRRKFERRW